MVHRIAADAAVVLCTEAGAAVVAVLCIKMAAGEVRCEDIAGSKDVVTYSNDYRSMIAQQKICPKCYTTNELGQRICIASGCVHEFVVIEHAASKECPKYGSLNHPGEQICIAVGCHHDFFDGLDNSEGNIGLGCGQETVNEPIRYKKCPKCGSLNHPSQRFCIAVDCFHKFFQRKQLLYRPCPLRNTENEIDHEQCVNEGCDFVFSVRRFRRPSNYKIVFFYSPTKLSK